MVGALFQYDIYNKRGSSQPGPIQQKVFELDGTYRITIEEGGARILNKYLRVKPHITSIVEDFWDRRGLSSRVLGIHFRGTDHSAEAPRVSYEHCLSITQAYLRDHHSIEAVFVAVTSLNLLDS